MSAERFDLVVVGAGSAAREAASRAALDHGASVALVERDLWGGQCPNNACKPTKQYVTAAELMRDLRAASDLGIDTGTVAFDLARLKARKDCSPSRSDPLKPGARADLPRGSLELRRSHPPGDGRCASQSPR